MITWSQVQRPTVTTTAIYVNWLFIDVEGQTTFTVDQWTKTNGYNRKY